MGLLLYCHTLARCGMATPPLEALFIITVKEDFITMREQTCHCAPAKVPGLNQESHAKVKMNKKRLFILDIHPLPPLSLPDNVSASLY